MKTLSKKHTKIVLPKFLDKVLKLSQNRAKLFLKKYES